ncbi:MAG: class I SAM-dependent methyltransferase [Gaiellales bacterium]
METDHTLVERRLLDEALRPGTVALDAGCGRTTRLRNYRDRIVRLVGMDVDDDAGLENPYLDEFVHADLCRPLPFPDGCFDLVYANFVVEHLEHPERAFAEWRRVLRPEGWLVLVTSNHASPFMAVATRLPAPARLAIKRRGAGAVERDVHPTQYRANTPDRLTQVASEAGFEPVAIDYVGTLHRYGARIPALGPLLKAVERALPAARRSTIVAGYRSHAGADRTRLESASRSARS